MYLKSYFYILIFFKLNLFSLMAWSEEIKVDFCPSKQLVRRSSQPHCAASYKNQQGESLCFSHKQWLMYFYHPHASLCGVYTLKRSVFSPLEPRVNHSKIQMSRYTVLFVEPVQSANYLEKAKKNIEKIREGISQRVRDMDVVGLLRSLILFEKAEESPHEWIRWIGFVHLYTETGIHLYILYNLSENFFFNIFSKNSIPTKNSFLYARLFSWVFILTTWILTGLREGLMRPLCILILRKFSLKYGFQWKIYSPLILSLSWDLVLWFYHWYFYKNSYFAQGRLYYGLAVGGGLFFYEWSKKSHFLDKTPKRLRSLLEHSALSIGSWIGPAIIEIMEWRWVALSTPLLNLVSIPITCTFFFPLSLILLALSTVLPELSLWLLGVITFLVNHFILYSASFSFQWGFFWHLTGSLQSVLVSLALSFFMSFLLLYGSRGFFLKRAIFLLFIFIFSCSVFFQLFKKIKKNENLTPKAHSIYLEKVVQLDVGQGDGALLFFSNGKIGMVDAGSFRHVKFIYWMKLLNYYNIKKIDFLFISHLDEDHYGGIFHLLRLIQVESIYTSRYEIKSQKGQYVQKKFNEFNHKLTEIPFSLSPYLKFLDIQTKGKNERNNTKMIALLFVLKDGEYFFTAGDALDSHEQRLIQWIRREIGPRGKIKIFKVNHHGSRHSNSLQFLKKLNPKVSWISCGFGNMYKHPHIPLLIRFQELGLKSERTDLSGSLFWSQ